MSARSLRTALACLTVAFTTPLACSSSNSAPGGVASTPCGDYFDARTMSPCGTGPSLPDAERSRVRARFVQICRSSMTLPGSQLTDGDLAACTSALRAAGCTGAVVEPQACILLGMLSGGAPCNEGFQCTSGLCVQAASVGEGGAPPPSASCGQCEAVVPAGQPCASGTCEQGTICDPTSAKRTCVKVTSGAVGAPCNGATAVCDAGLFCDVTSMTCKATFATGKACTVSGECTAPATCRAKKCQGIEPSGGGCYVDTDCAAGLGCSQALKCGPVVWAAAGEPCGDLVRCEVGQCDSTATCPAVVPDGQPCPPDPASTCDSLAVCAGGKCVLEDSIVCR